MAHELDFTNGNAAIAITYDGETPWHGYGNRVNKDADLDQWRIAAGLNWEVDERPVYFSRLEEGNRVPSKIDNRKALIRTDTQDCLSVVGAGYNVVQPKEVLEFYRELIADNGFVMDTAGALKGGNRVWALASIGESTRIMGQDKIDGYVLLATSYDGSMATTCKFVSTRVVCNNTLEWASKEKGMEAKASHSSVFNPEALKGKLGLTKESWLKYEEQVNKLAHTSVDLETALAFFTTLLGPDSVKMNIESGKMEYSNTFKKLYSAYETSPGSDMRSAKHTAWGLVNAVTFYQDHCARGNSQGSRLDSTWFGAGAARKQKAWEQALELVAA